MSEIKRTLLLNTLKLFDVALMTAAFLLAALIVLQLKENVTASAFFGMRLKMHNFGVFSLFVVMWHTLFRVFGLYESRRLFPLSKEVVQIISATTGGSLLVLFGAIAFHIVLITPVFLVVFWFASTVATISSHAILRVFLGIVRKLGRNTREIVIVGTGRRALSFARMLESRPATGYHIAGFVDHEWPGIDAVRAAGFTVVSDFKDFPEFLRNTVIDEVFLALPLRSMHDHASRVAACCEEQGITMRVLPKIFDLKIAVSTTEELEGAPLITHTAGYAEGWPIALKRVYDLIIALLTIAVTSPLLLIAAIAIKATSPGPVLFVQKRLGLNKRPFKLYKFRTMVPGAEARLAEIAHLNEVPGPVFKIINDPRITPVGRLLRKTSTDELPQLFNVLKGDMSLVGPRPLPVRDYVGFNEDWQRRRFSVKPGITCLWQIGGRSSIPFDKWMELDLRYIDQWSVRLDFEILLRTIPAVLKGTGAA